jgi:WD40 repeat protein
MGPGRRTLGPKLVDTFTGHQLGVYDVAFSPDGTRVATASWDRTAMVWFADPIGPDGLLRSDRVHRVFRGHLDVVTAVAFHRDGRYLATGSADGTARLWDTEAGKELNRIPQPGKVSDVALSPNGRLLAIAAVDPVARVWDCMTGGMVLEHQVKLHASVDSSGVEQIGFPAVVAVAFSPDGNRLAIGTTGGAFEVVDIPSRVRVLECRGHQMDLHRVVFSPKGLHLATASYDGTAKIWDAVTGRELQVLGGYTKWVLALAFDPTGKKLAVGSRDHSAAVWDVSSGKKLFALPRHAGGVWGADFSPDGRLLATAGYDGAVQMWELPRERSLF